MSRVPASERILRLLALIPWISERDGPTVDEVCQQFGLAPGALLADLHSLDDVGIHPYLPDDFITVIVEDDRVWIHYADYFRKPLRLTTEEALALVAAGQALRSVTGADPAGPLARGIAKLAASLQIELDATEVQLGPAPTDTLAVLQQAVAEHRVVEVDYYAHGRNEGTHRVIEPAKVFADSGQWYVVGHCRTAGGERVFRIDRIGGASLLQEQFDPPAEPPTLAIFQPRPDDPLVTLRLSARAGWVIEQYPVVATRARPAEEGGGWEVDLVVTARPWLERLLLRLGPDAEVVSAEGGLADAGVGAARRLLARYGSPRAGL